MAEPTTAGASKRASTVWLEAPAALAPPRPPTEPLRAEVLLTSRLAPDADALVERALSWVRWAEAPPLEVDERTAWAPVDPPLAVALRGVSAVRSVKAKGVGYGDRGGAVPPSGVRYADSLARGGHAHVGIEDDGSFCLRRSDPAPLGGMALPRAIAEFRNAERLLAAGCASIVPLAVVRYRDLTCEWAPDVPLGVAVSGGPADEPLRMAGLAVADPDAPSCEGRACRAFMDVFGGPRERALANAAECCGRTLRRFHEAGLFRHNGFPTNYLLDPERGAIALVDLDSSLPLASIPPVRQPLEIVRDVAGGLFSLAAIAMLPAGCERLPPGSYARARVLERFVEGYFHDLDDVPAAAIAAFREHFAERQERTFAYRAEIAGTAAGERILNEHWLDRPYAYAKLIEGLVEPFERCALARRYPPAASPAEVAERARAFLSRGPTTRW